MIEAAVAGRADADYGRRPIAWLVAAPGQQLDLAQVRRFCADRLAGYKIPVTFTIVDELPRTPLGKIALQALPDVFSENEVKRK